MKIKAEITSGQRPYDGLAAVRLFSDEIKNIELDLPFTPLHRVLGMPNELALDFLLLASICYIADKGISRKASSDVWTRTLSIDIPVADRKRWAKTTDNLNAALSFLSGDVWNVSFCDATQKLFLEGRRRRFRKPNPDEPTNFHAVSLLSGGLDSVIGVIDFLAENETSNLMLVGHYDTSGPKSQQLRLFETLKTAYPNRLKLVQARISQRPRKSTESSLRARSIAFLALGVYAAATLGPDIPVLTPENGFIALNLPLTPSRIGSCSTRTMHPFYLDQIRIVLKKAGLTNEIVNPLGLKTKPECVATCKNPKFLAALAGATVSCSHGTRRQHWKRRNVDNCGYCMPCLLRRVSLHAAGLDAGQNYGIDVCSGELNLSSDLDSADDLRAVVDALGTFRSDGSIRRALRNVAPIEPIDEYVGLIHRGFDQIREWIRDSHSKELIKAMTG